MTSNRTDTIRDEEMTAMDENTTTYRMYKLMQFPEIEAFAAQKKAGSRTAYFNRLDTFFRTAPALVNGPAFPANDKELVAFLKRITELQKLLVAIGSPSLLWGAEKVVEWAALGDKKKCGDAYFILSSKVNTLCQKLEDAKADFGTLKAIEVFPAGSPAPSAPPEHADLPKASIRSEPFEKLCLLMDNFEIDGAMETLHSLMGFTYTPEVDGILVSIRNALCRYDHAAATGQGRRLLDIAKAEKSGTAILGRKKILAVDDVPDVLNTAKSVLKSIYSVYGVTNHMDALKFLTANSADLILLDIEMPDMNGFALLSIIRKIKAYEKTPILFLTGNVSMENIKKSQSTGANGFIKKPVDGHVLLTKVKQYLD